MKLNREAWQPCSKCDEMVACSTCINRLSAGKVIVGSLHCGIIALTAVARLQNRHGMS